MEQRELAAQQLAVLQNALNSTDEPGPAVASLRDAQRKLAAATATREALLARARAGEQVNPSDLTEADAAVRLAGLRVPALMDAATAEAIAGSHARWEDFQDQVRSQHRADATAVHDALDAFGKALDELEHAVVRHNGNLQAAASSLHAYRPADVQVGQNWRPPGWRGNAQQIEGHTRLRDALEALLRGTPIPPDPRNH